MRLAPERFFRECFERFFRESHVSSFCCSCVRITVDRAYMTPVRVYPLQRCHAADVFRACVETWGVCLKEAATCIACHLPRMSWYTAQSGHRVRSSSCNAMLMVLRIVNLHRVVLAVNAQRHSYVLRIVNVKSSWLRWPKRRDENVKLR